MKILHATDLHLRASRSQESLEAVDAIRTIAEENQIDLIALSGDTWDGPIQNTAGSYFPVFVERIRKLAGIAPVVMIYGTPSHDTEGSLEVFEQVQSGYGITILQPGMEYYLSDLYAQEGWENPDVGELLIYGVPEPSKKWIAKWSDNKEAAEAGGRQAMRNLFLGLAAKRREHADLPCLLLYHGEIAGASTSTGYESEKNTNLVVTREDLEAVGADYVAAGHIHEPQQVGATIHYAGSAYSQWGEYHKPGVNLVTIDPNATTDDLFSDPLSVQRIDLPHPQRVKITREDVERGVDYSGKLTWYEITCTQEEASSIDTEAEKGKLIANGALEGSRVTLNILPTETVRAEEIADAQRLRDKLKVWAESSGDELSESLLEKADELEEEAAREGTGGEGAHIRIDRLDLRGAIGVWKGTGLDTVSIDFGAYDPGLIALIGANGKGKTTLIENMHPWPSMLTREAKLQDHFRLRDSYRDLYFTDERSGEQYRALMQIDGQNKSGSVDYYLYRWDGANWQPLPGINGRKDPYIEAIENLYGSMLLYLKSVFISQRPTKGNPDLSDATKGERKSLFRELAGLDYLQVHADRAKELAKEKEADINTSSGRLEALEEQLERMPEIRERARRFSDEDLLVVPAREVFTGNWRTRKHVLALGLSDPIPDFISLEAAFEEFDRQDATVLVPHPTFLNVSLGYEEIQRYSDQVAAVEAYNPKLLGGWADRAKQLVADFDAAPFGSSYAHVPGSVGEVWTAFDREYSTAPEVVAAFAADAPRRVGRRSSVSHRVRKLTEFAHLGFENTWEKADRIFLQGTEPTHPRHLLYDGRFDDVAVY